MGREHGAKTMARICLNHLTNHDRPVLAVGDVTGTLQPGRIIGFRGSSGAGTIITVRMPVELTRAAAGITDHRGQDAPNRARRPSNPVCAGPTLLPAGPGVVSS